MDAIDLSGLSIADAILSEPDRGTFGDAPRPPVSPKLRDKLNKLGKWRIDPSLIEFPEGTFEFEGGHAKVSRALLTPASAAANLNEPKNVKGRPSPGDGRIKKKVVAVKKLKTGNGNSLERVLEFALREAGFLVELSHGHIIELEGFVADLNNDRVWLIFPWEEHGNLKDFVASQDWEIPERIWLISDVTYGVQHLHSRDPPILHGDLKSINILVTSRCRAVITDFGSARRRAKKDVELQMKRPEQKDAKPPPDFQATFCATTNTMTFTGNEYTLRWAAPELIMDEEPGLSSDIWALGWIFYEVMTDSVPFENVQKDSMVIKHVIEGRLPCVADHIRVSLILRLSALMVKCWNVDPTRRPTAEECRKFLNWMPMVVPVLRRASDQASSRTRSPELLMTLGHMYKDQNDCINASILYTEALNLFTESSNKKGMASALYGLGWAHWAQCEYSKAATSYSKALEIGNDIGDRQGRSYALWGLAKVNSDQGDYSKAIALYSEVIQTAIDLDDQEGRASALRGLAHVHQCQNDYDKAVTSYSEAVEIYTTTGNVVGRTTALAGLAEVLRLQSKYSEAFVLFTESLNISTEFGNKFGRAFALWGLADIHRDQGRPRDALDLYGKAVEIFEQIGYTHNATLVSKNAARVRSQLQVEPVKTE